MELAILLTEFDAEARFRNLSFLHLKAQERIL